MKTLGDSIKYLRSQLGWSQKKLAEELNLSQQAIGKWETGLSEPDSETLSKLATIFDVSVDYLLGRTDDKNGIALEGVYFRLESEVQELGLPPEDVQKVIDLYKKYTKME